MPAVDQMLRVWARTHGNPPFWVVEKDYALSYLLAGIARVEELREGLILKGATALRKMYFGDYRFSEDLDFSTCQETPVLDVDEAVGQTVREMDGLLQERGPFRVEMERLILREPHPRGQDAFVVRVQFPAHRKALCRLKVEITRDEVVLLPPQQRALLHEFPEEKVEAGLWCYPLEEIVAEKLRALLQSHARLQQRGWGASRVCRDYYDLWHILGRSTLQRDMIPSLVARKCAHRAVTFDSPVGFFAPALVQVAQEEWDRQLRPFVSDCPDAQQVLTELQPLVTRLWAG